MKRASTNGDIKAAADRGVYVTLAELLDLRWPGQQLELDIFSHSVAGLPGDTPSRVNGNGSEFNEIRLWQPGDSIRNIEWRATARRAETLVRQHTADRERPVFLLIDQTPTLFFGSAANFKSVVAARLAALLGWSVLAAGERLGGQVVGVGGAEQFACSRDRQSLLRLLQSLVQANNALHARVPSSDAFVAALTQLPALSPAGASSIIISDFQQLRASDLAAMAVLARRGRLLLIEVLDGLERQLDLRGYLTIASDTSQHSLSFGAALCADYRRRVNRQRQRLHTFAAANNVTLLHLSTEQLLPAALVDALAGRVAGADDGTFPTGGSGSGPDHRSGRASGRASSSDAGRDGTLS